MSLKVIRVLGISIALNPHLFRVVATDHNTVSIEPLDPEAPIKPLLQAEKAGEQLGLMMEAEFGGALPARAKHGKPLDPNSLRQRVAAHLETQKEVTTNGTASHFGVAYSSIANIFTSMVKSGRARKSGPARWSAVSHLPTNA